MSAGWFMAYCDECGDDFACLDQLTREAWAKDHHDNTEHVVRYWTAVDQLIPGLAEETQEAQ